MADYKVKKGDTLSAIAKAAGTTVKAIQAANPQITNVNLIKPGQVFTIPGSSTPGSGSTGTAGTGSTGTGGGTTKTEAELAAEKAAADAAAAKAAADAKAVADKKAQDEKDLAQKRDAFAVIKSTLTTYGFTTTEVAELNTFIEAGLTNAKMGPEQLKLDMRELPTYKARFAGNTTRVSAGLNALSEAQYLEQEDNYSEIFKMYGVGNLSSRAQFASLIGNNISVTETTRRIDAAVKRVKNADPAVLTTLKNLYPSITDTDIVAYFLKPTEMLPELERKTTVAEIGATAKQFGMKENGLARFEDLQTYGVNLAKAREGYATIAAELPDITKLSSIYDEMNITYGQTEAEQEQFKGSATAKKNKERLVQQEKSSFKGSSGISKVSLTNTPAGQF
jgi:LysM repeat protein